MTNQEIRTTDFALRWRLEQSRAKKKKINLEMTIYIQLIMVAIFCCLAGVVSPLTHTVNVFSGLEFACSDGSSTINKRFDAFDENLDT